VLFYGDKDAAAAVQQTVKTDHDTLRETYRFLRGDGDERGLKGWESTLAKKYYDKVRTVPPVTQVEKRCRYGLVQAASRLATRATRLSKSRKGSYLRANVSLRVS